MTSIPIDNIKHAILFSGTADMTGLYEIIWRLNTLYPDISVAEKIQNSQVALQELLNENLAKIYKTNRRTKTEEKLDLQSAKLVILKNSSWDTPSDQGDCYELFCGSDQAFDLENKLYKKIGGNQ